MSEAKTAMLLTEDEWERLADIVSFFKMGCHEPDSESLALCDRIIEAVVPQAEKRTRDLG